MIYAKLIVESMLKKLKIDKDEIKRGEYSDIFGSSRPTSEKEKERINMWIVSGSWARSHYLFFPRVVFVSILFFQPLLSCPFSCSNVFSFVDRTPLTRALSRKPPRVVACLSRRWKLWHEGAYGQDRRPRRWRPFPPPFSFFLSVEGDEDSSPVFCCFRHSTSW